VSTPRYRYLLCDLLTDQPLAQLPLTGVSFGRRISRTGSLSATLVASNPALVGIARTLHAYAGRSALWVYRDQALWGGFIPWTVQAHQGPRGPVQVSVQAATFDSYAHRRRLYADKTYAGVDQGVIIPDLWRTLQSDPRGDIGVVAEDQPTGILRDRTYLASEHAYVGKLIEDLGDVIDGPEHTIDTFLDGTGGRIKRLRLDTRLGLTTPRAVFQRAARGGGSVQEWDHIADAVDGGTTFQTRGDALDGNVGAEKQPQLSTLVERTDLLDAGWPLLDVTEDRSGVTDLATLDGHAQALADQYGGSLPMSSYTVTVGNTGWSPNRIGDSVRIKLRDGWHDTSTDVTVRPVGCEVSPPEGDQPETVKLILSEDD
jgi:hypothetical protein